MVKIKRSMSPSAYRKLALALPETIEHEHMGHPDFRVGGRIFATLRPDAGLGMVRLFPAQQAEFVTQAPKVFSPVPGGWGRRGATYILLKPARAASVKAALLTAWLNTAPAKLIKKFQSGQ